MIAVSLVDSLREDRAAVYGRPVQAAALAMLMAFIALGHLVRVDSLVVPVKAVALLLLVRESSEVLALMVALYVAYRWHPALGAGAMLLFLAILTPYYFADFWAHFPELVRLLFVGLITLFGIRLIAELRRAVELMRQREREIGALAGLNANVLNDRIRFLEESTQKGERLERFQRAVCLASQVETPRDIGKGLLPLVMEEVGAEYASLTPATPDGVLGERVDSFFRVKPFPINNHTGDLAAAVLRSGKASYIADTRADPQAHTALVAAGIRSYVGLPLRTPQGLVGVLFLHSTRPNAFLGEGAFLDSAASLVAGCLHRGLPETQAMADVRR